MTLHDAADPATLYAEVLLARRHGEESLCLTYAVPPELAADSAGLPGAYVLVPLGNGLATGWVIRLATEPPEGEFAVKPVHEVLAGSARLSEDLMRLGEWLAEWTCTPLAICFQTMIPAGAQEEVTVAYEAAEPGAAQGQASLFEADDMADSHDPVLALFATVDEPLTLGEVRAIVGRELPERTLEAHVRAGRLRARHIVVPARTSRKTLLGLERVGTPEEVLLHAKALVRKAKAQAEILEQLARCEEPLLLIDLEKRRVAAQALVTRGLARVVRVPVLRRPAASTVGTGKRRFEATPAQRSAVEALRAAIDRRAGESFVLYGVTGSGKTEVYLDAIEHALAQGGRAIVLVPEIALTPQTVGRFQARFGERVAVLHSQLGMGERHDEWTRARDGEADIVIGARSAVFAPVQDLRLIVLDEEHERSYKQESSPRYHARDVALRRARLSGAALVLGSATPSVESYHAALTGEHGLLRLPDRVGGGTLPSVEIVDLRRQTRARRDALVSEPLSGLLTETLAREEQAILLLNRRGWSPFLLCQECGEVVRCHQCDVSLTYHQRDAMLRCHHCGHEEGLLECCPACKSRHVRAMGTGTERAEREVREFVPDARVIRMDRDTTREKGSHARLLSRFERGEADILIGTQMIAKGLDFPRVTLVGVILADVGLHFPDFRAPEHTFSLLAQVAGRAGRGERPGRVVIQTFSADHWAIQTASRQDYQEFYGIESHSREEGLFPPFTRMANVLASDEDEFVAESVAEAFATVANGLTPEGGRLLGPAPCPIMKLRGKSRFHAELYAPRERLGEWVTRTLEGLAPDHRKLLQVDMDPLSLL